MHTRTEEWSIGELGAKSGLNASAIRYYETLGLLPEPQRVGGKRRYNESALTRLSIIDVAQRAGFTLAETRTLLMGFSRRRPPSQHWRALAERKLSEVDDMITRANEMKRLLREGIDCDCISLEDCEMLLGNAHAPRKDRSRGHVGIMDARRLSVGNGARPLIRAARAGDASDITGLLAELGYPDELSNVRERLGTLGRRDDAGVLVAVIDGSVAGVAAYQLMDLLERRQPQCRITALVVDADQRRRGVARALIDAIESIATQRGCFRLEVTTRPQRPAATDFYLTLGFYERRRRLVKPLGR